jgi:prepilin-type N-terminal cleavage/methylation domain-containing protein
MNAMNRLRDRRGFTMVEMIVAVVISVIVLGAAYTLLRNNQRFYRSQSQIVDVQQNLRAVAELLPAELRELSAEGGDILAMSDTALTIRAPRGLGVVCFQPDAVMGTIILRDAQWFGYRTIDATRDGIYIFTDNDTTLASDDRWTHADITATSAAVCADGTRGTLVTLANIDGGPGTLAGAYVGAPVRTHETVTYRLYSDGSDWWLGVTQLVSGAWTATSPVAGPLRANDGLQFSYLDANSAVTADSSQVTWIALTIRAESNQPIDVQGRPTGTYSDSLSVRVALRGN